MRAAPVPRAMPLKVRPPRTQVKSAMPMTRARAAVLRLTGSEKSTRFCTQMRTPSMPIMP